MEAGVLVAKAVSGLNRPARLRLVLGPDGAYVRRGNLDHVENHDRPPGVQRLCVDPEPVASTNPALFHKTTDRRRYEERAQRHPSADDVVLVNERNELAPETTAVPTWPSACRGNGAPHHWTVGYCPESSGPG